MFSFYREEDLTEFEKCFYFYREEDLTEFEKTGSLYQAGIDKQGRPVIVFIGKYIIFRLLLRFFQFIYFDNSLFSVARCRKSSCSTLSSLFLFLKNCEIKKFLYNLLLFLQFFQRVINTLFLDEKLLIFSIHTLPELQVLLGTKLFIFINSFFVQIGFFSSS